MPQAPNSTRRRQVPLEGSRILVVDDHAHTAALMKQTLLSAGATEVIVAADGEAALAMLATVRPDILITDLIMPQLGGLELIRAVRHAALSPTPEVPDATLPIVLVSAFASRRAVRVAREAGIDAFVVKPFSTGSLVKRVDRANRRTAEFLITATYVGPDRRGKARDAGAAVLPPVAIPAGTPQVPPAPQPDLTPLRLVEPDEEGFEAASPSLLKSLYERIRALEDEQAAMREARGAAALEDAL